MKANPGTLRAAVERFAGKPLEQLDASQKAAAIDAVAKEMDVPSARVLTDLIGIFPDAFTTSRTVAVPQTIAATALEQGQRPAHSPFAARLQSMLPPPATPDARLAPLEEVGVAAQQPEVVQQLGRALSGLLGIEIPEALTDLSIDDLRGGSLQLTLILKNDKAYRIPYGDGDLNLELPASSYGTRVRLNVELGTAKTDGPGQEKGEPVIKSVALQFEGASWHRDFAWRLPNKHLPYLQNPSRLQPSTSPLLDAVKDTVADVRFKGLTINEDGEIKLEAKVTIFKGLFDSDFDALAHDALPTLHTSIRELAAGNIVRLAAANDDDKGPSSAASKTPVAPLAVTNEDDNGQANEMGGPSPSQPPTPPPGVAALLRGFNAVAESGVWKLKLEANAETPLTIESSGALAAGEELSLRAATKNVVRNAETGMLVRVKGKHDHPSRTGAAKVKLGIMGPENESRAVHREPAALGVKWNADGMTLDQVEIEKLIPVRLHLWNGSGPAPRVGTAGFQERLGSLLDASAPVRTGNKTSLIRSGTELLQKRLDLINRAGPSQTLLLQTFILRDDTTGEKVVDALIAAHRRGATVKVLLDTVGCASDADEVVTGNTAFKRLQAAGVDVHLHNAPTAILPKVVAGLEAGLSRAVENDAELRSHLREQLPATARMFASLKSLGGVDVALSNPALMVSLAAPLAAAAVELNGKDPEQLPAVLLPLVGALGPLHEILNQEGADFSGLVRELLVDLSRDHRKSIALYGPGADGTQVSEFLTGGNNIADAYQLEPDSPDFDSAKHGKLHLWNDAHVHVSGPTATADLVQGFVRGWKESGAASDVAPVTVSPAVLGQPQAEEQREALRVVNHFPISSTEAEGDNHFSNLMLATLEGMGVGDEMVIQNPYFLPLPEIKQAMLEAADRGAQLSIYGNGTGANNDAKIIAEQSRQFVLPALVAHQNIALYETLSTVQPIHRKTVAVRTQQGKTLAVVGSQNMDRLSAGINREMFLLSGSGTTNKGDAAQNDQLARGLFQDAERDRASDYSRRLQSADLEQTSDEALNGYFASLARPVL